MRDVIPFADQVSGQQNCFAALGFELERVLKAFAPRRIETQSRFVEQQHRRIGQKQKRKPKSLPRATRELASANTCDFAKAGEIEHRLASRWREAAQSP